MPSRPQRATSAPRSPRSVGLVGPWVANRGDELMLHAVFERIDPGRIAIPVELWPGEWPEAPVGRVALPPRPAEGRLALSRGDLGRLVTLGLKAGVMTLPRPALSRLTGHEDARELDLLLDCSGFAYGDDWSTDRMHRRADYFATLKESGTRIVLLPQALGPFETEAARNAARALFAQCAVVYARDEDSLAHMTGLDLPEGAPRLERAPDITHLFHPAPPADAALWRDRIAIVPNARMMDKTGADRAAAYEGFIGHAVEASRAAGLEPWLLLHEDNDHELVHRLASTSGGVPVLEGDGPTLKAAIGAARLVVASRYHALVSALSQAVPAIGTSWSHKYDRLFEEYRHSPYLLRPEAGAEAFDARFNELLSEEGQKESRSRLSVRAAEQSAAVEAMWRDVESLSAGG